MTEDGHPWIGAENPELTIIEFTDYQCFQCKKMHFFLRSLIENHPDKIRLVHRHFPMDHKFNSTIVPEPFHEGSGEMALLAIYAAAKGKFWEMNDLLFELGTQGKDISINFLARKTGLDPRKLSMARYSRKARRWLTADIWKGMKLRILGTPGYLINGQVYQGYIPPEIIRKAIE
jgi:protein-disulfide isomerase